ncbi:MAG: hypothetical protein WBO46_17315, partial [Caldilineaceae bacterium]
MELYTNSHGKPTPPAPPAPAYDLTGDPLFYGTVAFFVLLTTVVPGVMGQPNFMPIIQALALTVFTAIALRRGGVGTGLRVAAVWLLVQGLLFFLLTWLLPVQVEKAIHDGFLVRTGFAEWVYTGSPAPGSLLAAPVARLGEIAGIVLGSLATVGLVGGWFLVKGVTLLAYAMATLWQATG